MECIVNSELIAKLNIFSTIYIFGFKLVQDIEIVKSIAYLVWLLDGDSSPTCNCSHSETFLSHMHNPRFRQLLLCNSLLSFLLRINFVERNYCDLVF